MLAIPRLLAVSDRATLGAVPPRAWRAWCAALSALGVDGLELREPRVDDRALYELALAARDAFPAPGCLLVNRRCDLALAVGADGVHLPAAGLPIATARAIVGPRRLVGRSTHRVDEVSSARHQGADYVLFGPVFDTPSKRGLLPPHGLAGLAEAAAVGLPVIAIGGLAPGNVAAALAAGAVGIAAIRAFGDADSAAAMVAAAAEAAR